MEYFENQSFSMEPAADAAVSPAERAFIKKYLGVDDPGALAGLPEAKAQAVAGFAAAPHIQAAPAQVSELASMDNRGDWSSGEGEVDYPSLDETLRSNEAISLVSFYVCQQRFVIPLDAVQEVISYQQPFRLPMAPSHVTGVINLRGHVTPIVRLEDLLLLPRDRVKMEGEKLFIICHCKGLQLGLQIDKINTMYRAGQDKLDWNIDAQLGASAEFFSGLLTADGKLISIVSVERIVDKLIGA